MKRNNKNSSLLFSNYQIFLGIRVRGGDSNLGLLQRWLNTLKDLTYPHKQCLPLHSFIQK